LAEKLAVLKGRTYFLGVGAQKAGTTWLSYYLREHPDVYFSPIKEMHFWGNRTGDDKWPGSMFRKKLAEREEATGENPDVPAKLAIALRDRLRMGGDVNGYRRYFRRRVKHQSVFGEITPAYCRLKREELAFIREQFPKTKVIFLLRNPADRMWSQLRFSENFETLEELEGKVERAFQKAVYKERFDYVTTIRNLRAEFPADHVHFEFYERLFTPEAIEGICNFLEIKPFVAQFEKTRNVSIKVPLSPELRQSIVERLKPQYTFCRDAFSGDLPANWLSDLQSMT
jgi:hypothetical protein